jgi:CheY-like chemotaxis protein
MSAEAVTSDAQAASRSKLRVMFVEDNDFVRELTMCLLEGADREVVAFGSAEEAYEEFTHNPFDVVITDVSLPKMSGIELTKRLVAIAPDTWFVIASGYQLPPGIEKLGAHVRAMTKPFESEKMDVIFSEIRTSQRAVAR